jgi:competence protein ComEA
MIRNFLAVSGLVVALAVFGVVGLAQETGRRGSSAKATATPASPVNLNTATPIELQSLPGVGPATATRIVEYRQKNGGFKKIEDLMNITGIGEKTFLRLKPLVTLAARPADANVK